MPSFWSSDVCSRSEEHTSELQSHDNLVCRLLLEQKRSHRGDRDPRGPARSGERRTPAARARPPVLPLVPPRLPAGAGLELIKLLLFFFEGVPTPRLPPPPPPDLPVQ